MKRYSKALLSVGLTACLASVFAADQPRIVDEGKLKERDVTSDGPFAAPGTPASLARQGDDVCLTLGYRIDSDGTTSNYGVLKSWSSSSGEERPKGTYWDDVINASAAAVSKWKFKSASGAKAMSPVYTAVTFSFSGRGNMTPDSLRGNCRVSDLTALLQDIKSKRYQIGQPSNFLREQFQRDRRSQASMVSNPGSAAAAGYTP